MRALELAFELVSLRSNRIGLRKALEHLLDVVSQHEKEKCAACQEAQRLLTDEWS